MIEAFRANEISRFTFSSGWSGSVDTAWLFVQNGCRLVGLTEINGTGQKFMSDEWEKVHAYEFIL